MKIALVAHDSKKADIVELARRHLGFLTRVEIIATGTTGRLVAGLGLKVQQMNSGPYGGDLQVGAAIASGEVDALIFLRDPLTAHAHEPDVSALMKVCDIHNIPLATNVVSADLVLDSLAERARRKVA